MLGWRSSTVCRPARCHRVVVVTEVVTEVEAALLEQEIVVASIGEKCPGVTQTAGGAVERAVGIEDEMTKINDVEQAFPQLLALVAGST